MASSTDLYNRSIKTSTAERSKSSTPLPTPSNNFASLGYSFILLDEKGFPVQELTLAVPPEEIVQSEVSTSNVVMTAGDAFTDSFGPGLTRVAMSGTFGQRPTGNSLFGLVQGSPTASGQYLVLQLRDMFRKYLDKLNPIITGDAKVNAKTVLQFYNPKDNEFWNIEPVGNWFVLSRSKNAPFLYRYKLSFVCTGRASAPSIFDFQRFRSQVTNVVGAAYDSANTAMTTLSSNISSVISLMVQIGSAEKDYLSSIYTPMASLQSAVNTYLASSSSIINYTPSGMEEIRGAIAGVRSDYASTVVDESPSNSEYLYTGPYSSPIMDPLVDYQFTQLIKNIDSYELNSNLFSKNFIKSDFITQTTEVNPGLSYISLSSIKSITYYTIRGGDTIEGIAQATLGDSRYWRSLAEFNNLVYPYITAMLPKPDRTLGPGDFIAIPSSGGSPNFANVVLGASVPDTKDPAYSLGSDLFLSPSGDISISDNDLELISGVSDIKQAIFLKLNIRRGELPLHQYYGMSDLRGYRTAPLLAAKAQAEFSDTIYSDARVGNVNNSVVTINGDTVNYRAEVGIKLTNQPILLEGSLGISS
jgi:hypothetical protein